MKLADLKDSLRQHRGSNIRFVLPGGDSVPAHAHVTEVARIDKRFIDCGGTLRHESMCRLQTWVADDTDHRLTAATLLKILEKASSVLGADDLEVDVEHEVGLISQFPLEAAKARSDQVVLHLAARHTACLAQDKCKPAPSRKSSYFDPRTIHLTADQESGGCCTGKD